MFNKQQALTCLPILLSGETLKWLSSHGHYKVLVKAYWKTIVFDINELLQQHNNIINALRYITLIRVNIDCTLDE